MSSPITPADKMQPDLHLEFARMYLRSRPTEVEQFTAFLDDIGADQTTIFNVMDDWHAMRCSAQMQCQFTHFYTVLLSLKMENASVQQELIEVISSLRTMQQDNESIADTNLLQRQQQSLRNTVHRMCHSFPHNANRVGKPNYPK